MAISISILFLLMPGICIAETLPREQTSDEIEVEYVQDEQPASLPSYIPVELNMGENNGLNPELPPADAADSAAVCPNGFTPAWWSVRKRRGSTDWRDVGTWQTIRMGKQLQATGIIRFTIWVTFLGSGSPGSSDFEFNWLRNEDTIASTVITNVDLSSGMDPIRLNPQAHLINQTPFEVGDVFKLFIRCRISLDGARILYGSPAHRSFVLMTCDPLDVLEVSACDHGIKGLYADVFKVKYTELTFIARVDKMDVVEMPEFGVENVNNGYFNFVSWPIKLEPRTYEIEVGVSYVPNDNTSVVSKIEQIRIRPKVEPTWFGLPVWLAQLIIGLVVLVVVLVIVKVVHSKIQERRWLKEMESET